MFSTETLLHNCLLGNCEIAREILDLEIDLEISDEVRKGGQQNNYSLILYLLARQFKF